MVSRNDWKRQKKLNENKNFDEKTYTDAKYLIEGIFGALDLPRNQERSILGIFNRIYYDLEPGTKFRNPQKVIPGIIYKWFQFQHLMLKVKSMCEIAGISNEEFGKSLKAINFYFQKYKYAIHNEKERLESINGLLFSVRAQFLEESSSMDFYEQAVKIVEALWSYIKNSKDYVIAAFATTLSSYCYYKGVISANKITKHLGIGDSSINKMIKRVFGEEQLRKRGYRRLNSTQNVLREILDIKIARYNNKIKVLEVDVIEKQSS